MSACGLLDNTILQAILGHTVRPFPCCREARTFQEQGLTCTPYFTPNGESATDLGSCRSQNPNCADSRIWRLLR